MTLSRERLAKTAATVAASEAKIDKQRAQMTTINTQLGKAQDDVAAAVDILATVRTNMVTKEERADDLEHADWLRNMEAKTKTIRKRPPLSKVRSIVDSNQSQRRLEDIQKWINSQWDKLCRRYDQACYLFQPKFHLARVRKFARGSVRSS